METLEYQDSDAKKEIDDISTKNSWRVFRFSIEISMEDFQLVVVERYKFEYRVKSIQIAHFGLLDCKKSDAQIKMKNLMIYFASSEKFSMQTLFGKNISIITQKYEFERRDKTYIVKFIFYRYEYWD